MLQVFVKQTTKGNKHPQTVQDALLREIFLEDDYREINVLMAVLLSQSV
jgi:hypothetical protein